VNAKRVERLEKTRDIARGCVTALWNRIANTHIGLRNSPHQSNESQSKSPTMPEQPR
jgi:hypothetical protein